MFMMEQCLKEQNIRENGGRDKMIRRNFLKLFTLFGANATLSANNTIDSIKEKELSSIELNECYLAGLQYYDGKDFDASHVSFFSLKREPDNKFDKNAIEVYCKEVKIGYIPRAENKIIAKMMDQNIRIVAKVSKFNADEIYRRIKVKLYQLVG